MKDESRTVATESAKAARRRFLRTSGRVAVAAPAVAILFAATQNNAMATPAPYRAPPIEETPV